MIDEPNDLPGLGVQGLRHPAAGLQGEGEAEDPALVALPQDDR